MALPDYSTIELGSEISWKSSGGTYAITLTSLANDAAREGAKGDLGATWEQEFLVALESAVGSAATAGKEVELYWGPSTSGTAGTDNPGNLTGADASLSNPDELKAQCQFVGSLVLSNARGTNVQRQYLTFRPPSRYGTPLVVNKSGQSLSGTAGNHAIRMWPLRAQIED